jgi:hypothetical protein
LEVKSGGTHDDAKQGDIEEFVGVDKSMYAAMGNPELMTMSPSSSSLVICWVIVNSPRISTDIGKRLAAQRKKRIFEHFLPPIHFHE